jgi:hypothetical protein
VVTSAVSERAGLGVTAVSGLALGLAVAAGSPVRGAISVSFGGVARGGRALGRTPVSRLLALC